MVLIPSWANKRSNSARNRTLDRNGLASGTPLICDTTKTMARHSSDVSAWSYVRMAALDASGPIDISAATAGYDILIAPGVCQYHFDHCPAPAPLPGFDIDARTECFRCLDGPDVSGRCLVANGSALVIALG